MKSTLAFIPALLAAGHLSAGTVAPVSEAPLTAPPANDWEITLGLYGWGAGLNGDLGANGFVAPVDLSFSDILDTLDMTFMGLGEVRKGNWLFQLEGFYLKNSISGVIANRPAPPLSLSAKLVAKTTRLTAVAGYRFVNRPETTVDVLAGVNYYDISNELAFFGPGAIFPVEASDDWVDPVIGIRVNQRLNERWSAQFRADIGGFGVESDFLYQLIGVFAYDFTPSTSGFIGWRHAAVDYEKAGFVYDVYNTGPILGIGTRF